jgi:hypothetical protein
MENPVTGGFRYDFTESQAASSKIFSVKLAAKTLSLIFPKTHVPKVQVYYYKH